MAKKPGTRIKTYYGIPVPPWPHEPAGRSLTLVFVLTGKIPSKKNELIAVVDRSDALKAMGTDKAKRFTYNQVRGILYKTFGRITNAAAYELWEHEAVITLTKQRDVNLPTVASKGLIFPLTDASVKIRLYWKDKRRRDNGNKSEGIYDALVKAHIISDDCYENLNPTHCKARSFAGEIVDNLAVIYLTVPL